MTTEKQIEEIFRDLCNAPTGSVNENFTIGTLKESHTDLFIRIVAGHLASLNYCKQSESEWISVEERLPSKEDLERSQFHSFLVANEFGEVREAVFTGKYFAKLGSRLSGVTHWMPLPEPPKMKGDEE